MRDLPIRDVIVILQTGHGTTEVNMPTPDMGSLFSEYERRLAHLGVFPIELRSGIRDPQRGEALAHALFMVREGRVHLKQQNLKRARQWLGFVEGVLWSHGIYSVEELRENNRST